MTDFIFNYLSIFEDFLWGKVGLSIIVLLGSYFCIKTRFFQIRAFPKIVWFFLESLFFSKNSTEDRGVHPIQTFFAAIGGCIGLGNLVAVCSAIVIGGPGAALWIWIAGLLGMLLKYAEVYLGVRYRVKDEEFGGYVGGPMYFLSQAFKARWVPYYVCILLCIYGVEMFMFNAIVESVSTNWHLNRFVVIAFLLALIFSVTLGGVKRVGAVSSVIIPIFVIGYVIMVSWVLLLNYEKLPEVFYLILYSGMTGKAVVGGGVGGSLLFAAYNGVQAGCYTGDIGIGYASVIHSETREIKPEKQASLAIFGIFLDTFVVCSMSILLILVTGVWKEPLLPTELVKTALAQYFPFMDFFMPLFLLILGFSTITAYLSVGIKSAQFVSPYSGKAFYLIYAVLSFILTCFLAQQQALTIMYIAGGLLMPINLLGVFKLRKRIIFSCST